MAGSPAQFVGGDASSPVAQPRRWLRMVIVAISAGHQHYMFLVAWSSKSAVITYFRIRAIREAMCKRRQYTTKILVELRQPLTFTVASVTVTTEICKLSVELQKCFAHLTRI